MHTAGELDDTSSFVDVVRSEHDRLALGELAFADDLADTIGAAEQRLGRLVSEIDAYADAVPGLAQPPPDPRPPVPVLATVSTVDLTRAGRDERRLAHRLSSALPPTRHCRVVPSLATGVVPCSWQKRPQVVPCWWQATLFIKA